MASTLIIYQGTGSQTDFEVPFDYLKKSFVTVSLQGTPLKGGDYGDTGADYYFLDKTKIRLKKAPASGQLLTVRRYTSQTQRVVSFKDASVLKATDLDASQLQAFHIAAEARDIINDALIQDKFDNWDAKNHRIVKLADPIDPQDAVTYKVYKQDAQGAYQSKLEAQKAKNTAKEWATKLGSKVNNEDYSSKYYAQQSSKSATASANSASSAETSAQTATTKASQAASSASTATTKASQASASASKAKTSETNAKTSETNSKSSETKAKTSEANAKVSETNSKESELKAKQYADQATAGQIQADWKQTDSTKKDFIKNKPTLGTLSTKNSLAYSELTGVPSSFTPSPHNHPISQITNLQDSLDAKTNDATLQVDLTAIRESITNVSSKVDGIGDTLSPTYAKKQTILDACDQAMNGANPVHAGDPTLDDIKLALATIQAQLGQLESRRYVKETGKSSNGKNWYRKWSDGWIEQGGVHTFSGTNKQTVVFMKSFSDTNYIALFTAGSRSGSGADISIYLTDKGTSSVGVMPDRSGNLNWYACGY